MRSRSSGQVLASFVVSVLLLAAPAFACSSAAGQDAPSVAGSAGSAGSAAGAASAGVSGQTAGASARTSGGAGAHSGGAPAAGNGGAGANGGSAGTTSGVGSGTTTGGTSAGNGGHSGSAGTDTAGQAGSKNNEATCQMVKTDYAAELEKQLACKPGAASQCTNRAAAAPGCECRVFIQPSDPFAIEHLSNVGNGWYDADCNMPSCPAKCTSAASGTCQADPKSALGGRCTTP